MGRGQRKEYSRGSLLEYRDSNAAEPWPDCFDLNYTLANDRFWSPVMWFHASKEGNEDEDDDMLRKDITRKRSEPVKVHSPVHHHTFSSPLATAPHTAEIGLSKQQASPFDFDDFLATLKTEEPNDVPQPQPTGSRFKQFFDSSMAGTPPQGKGKYMRQAVDPRVFNEEQSMSPPFQKRQHQASGQTHHAHLTPQQQQQQQQQHQQLARRGRRLANRRSPFTKTPCPQQPQQQQQLQHQQRSPEQLDSQHFLCNPFDCQNVDDITDADMSAAAVRFCSIKEASLASSQNETTASRPTEERPATVSPPPSDRDRPRFKNQQSSTPSRWSSPGTNAPPPPPPSSVATAALLQARLLAQQRSSGIFPGGQVAQLVRPPLPVYQAGVQAGLPLQSAALLSQFVWLNVL